MNREDNSAERGQNDQTRSDKRLKGGLAFYLHSETFFIPSLRCFRPDILFAIACDCSHFVKVKVGPISRNVWYP